VDSYVEYQMISHENGASKVAFYDPSGVGVDAEALRQNDQGALRQHENNERGHYVNGGHYVNSELAPSETSGTPQKGTTSTGGTTSRALRQKFSHKSHKGKKALPGESERLQAVNEILCMPPQTLERGKAIRAAAEKFGVSKRSIHNWVSKALQNQPTRAKNGYPAGRKRLPLETEHAIISALLSNTPETSVNMVYRTLLRAVPSLMEHEYGGRMVRVSAATVGKIKQRLLDDPHTSLLFASDDDKKEHIRVAVGKVFTAYANQLWEMDMTRCDTMVVHEGKIARPRIHAIIDVYSRTIPGLAFSFDEDQTQTDLALLRALVPKPAPYDTLWQVWGTPESLYWDNGKTYTSHHAERVCRELGIRSIHSRPHSSHTRGAIERFFGTLHGFEKTLPGYVGENAVKRSSEGMKRVIKNTEAWIERGYERDPGEGNRLLTLAEYQHHVLNWLLVEYHQGVYEGASRMERFLGTVPTATRAIPDRDNLMLIIGKRITRVVNQLGQVRINNEFWGIPDGSLINYQGYEVLIIEDQFALGNDRKLIAFEQPYTGELRVIGQAERAPEIAASSEADTWRRNAEAQAREAVQAQAALKREYADPTLVASNALQKAAQAQMDVATPKLPEPPKRTFEALDGDVSPEALAFAKARPQLDPVVEKIKARTAQRKQAQADKDTK
jgi:putative transposase